MTAPGAIRVLVVDDSVVVRQVVTDALSGDSSIQVVGQAPNGRVALEKLLTIEVDVVTLDLEMPEMDGLTTLRELRKRHPKLPVVVFSTLTERGATATMDALARGASDYVCKPAGQRNIRATMDRIREELIPKIRALAARQRPIVQRPAAPAIGAQAAQTPSAPVQLLVIGVSTGGPSALAELIPRLPANFPVPVVIVQHMPAVFTRVLAQRLDASSPLKVHEATHQDRLEVGRVYIAPGDHHLRVAGSPRAAWLTLDQGPLENGCRPAVDPMFHSAVQIFGSGVLAVVLTGLGCDGTKGASYVRKAGGTVWVQDEISSAVWGMPGSIVENGLANRILPLGGMARAILDVVRSPVERPPTPPRKAP